jgi:hypothetical protein
MLLLTKHPPWLLAALLLLRVSLVSAETRYTEAIEPRAKPAVSRPYWRLYHCANFTLCCPPSFDGDSALRHCETLRKDLSDKWLGDTAPDWSSRCYIVVHAGATTYMQAAGAGAEQTTGCSTVKELGGRVLSRRIDLRLDRPEPLTRALPHEMTHVVLADVVARY